MDKHHRVLTVLNYLGLLLISFGLLYLVYINFFPIKILDMETPIKISRTYSNCSDPIPKFKPGSIVPLEIRGEKFKNYTGYVAPRLINKGVVLLPPKVHPRPVGKFDEVSLSYEIPEGVHPGSYYFELNIIFPVSQVRDIKYTFKSEEFIVEK